MFQKNAFGQKKIQISCMFKRALLSIFQFFQNGTFENRAWNLEMFLTKSVLMKHYEMAIRKNIYNFSQGPPNQGFMHEKVQKGDFLKKNLRELKNHFCSRFL